MARYDESIIRDIESRVDIIDIIGETVVLTRKGGRYWGLCPFHGEKTPSFCVNRERQMFYCFGCHEGGNVFSFLMKSQNISFYESLRLLADRSGIKLPENENRKTNNEIEEFRHLHEIAASHYRNNLKGNELARAYLKKRGVSNDSIERFGLGYAIDSWDDLSNALRKAGFSQQQILKSGLVRISEKTGNLFDLLRKRIIFPIYQYDKSVIAFGGRTVEQGVEPKYINSPETMIFSKRRNLYGLSLARNSMRSTGTVFLVEGYMDCLKLSQAGILNVVASLGTAFTTEQASLLHRYVNKVILVYDGDEAGQRETVRASSLLQMEGIRTEILSLPGNMDPDEYITAFGKDGFDAYLEANHHSVIEFKLYRWLNQQGGRTWNREAISNLLHDIRNDFQFLPDEIEKDYHIDILTRHLKVEENTLRRELNGQNYFLRSGYNANQKIFENHQGSEISLTECIVAGMLNDYSCYQKIIQSIGIDTFKERNDRELLSLWGQILQKNPKATLNDLQYDALDKGLEGYLSRLQMIIDNGMAANVVRIDDYIVRIDDLNFINTCNDLKSIIEKMEKEGADSQEIRLLIEKIGQIYKKK